MTNEDNDKRKATDILLSLEAKISAMDGRFRNTENLLKILLSRINTVFKQPQAPQELPKVINKDNFDLRPKTSAFESIAQKNGVEVEESDIEEEDGLFVARPADLSADPSGEDMLEAVVRSNTRGQRGPKIKEKKCSVSQLINRGETPLFLANVEILDENGTVINQGRTNSKGRWMIALAPGEYQVHVLKRFPPDSGRKPVDVTYSISVPPSDKPMELDQLSLSDSV